MREPLGDLMRLSGAKAHHNPARTAIATTIGTNTLLTAVPETLDVRAAVLGPLDRGDDLRQRRCFSDRCHSGQRAAH